MNIEKLKRELESLRKRRTEIEHKLAGREAVRSELMGRLKNEFNIDSLEEARNQLKILQDKKVTMQEELKAKSEKVSAKMSEFERAVENGSS